MKIFTAVGLTVAMLVAAQQTMARVRTLHTNDKMMKTVNLQMGRSTVLRFLEEPKKVIIGNSNYISAEFIGNDVTLQPLSAISTNIFIYTPYRTYGLILKVGNRGTYDDLVYVRWKAKHQKTAHIRKSKSAKKYVGKKLHLKDVLNATIGRVFEASQQNLYVVEILVQNTGNKNLEVSDINVELTRSNKKLKKQEVVFKSDVIKPGQSVPARVVVTLESRRGFTLWVSAKGKKAKTIVPKALLL